MNNYEKNSHYEYAFYHNVDFVGIQDGSFMFEL